MLFFWYNIHVCTTYILYGVGKRKCGISKIWSHDLTVVLWYVLHGQLTLAKVGVKALGVKLWEFEFFRMDYYHCL